MVAETRYKIDAQSVVKRYPAPAGGMKTVLNDVNLRVRGGGQLLVLSAEDLDDAQVVLERLLLHEAPQILEGVLAQKPTRGDLRSDSSPVEDRVLLGVAVVGFGDLQ